MLQTLRVLMQVTKYNSHTVYIAAFFLNVSFSHLKRVIGRFTNQHVCKEILVQMLNLVAIFKTCG